MRPRRLVVGLTGGIGTGKSSALNAFKELGVATVCLDAIARQQAKRGGAGYQAIVKDFGACILKKNGAIDRERLGRAVFDDAEARAGLERSAHPLILKEMKRRVGRLRGVVIVDVPLLFEKNLQNKFDATVLISCAPNQQLQRVCARDGRDLEDARRRIAAQWPLAKKRRLADVTIRNDKNLAALKKKVAEYHLGLQLLYGGLPHGNNY